MEYLLLFGIVCGLSYIFETKRVHLFWSTLIIGTLLSLAIGLRDACIGNDTANYISIFKEILTFEHHSLIKIPGVEIGYVYLNYFIGYLTQDPHIALLIIAFLTIMPFIYTINKYSEIPWFSIALLSCLGFFSFSLSAQRQSLALALIFTALPLLNQRKTIRYALIVLLAMFFHTTAAVAFLLIPFVYIKPKRAYVLTALAASITMAVFYPLTLKLLSVIAPFYSHYFHRSYFDGTGWLASSSYLVQTLAFTGFIAIFSKAGQPKFRLRDVKDLLTSSNDRIGVWSLVLVLCVQILALRANILDRITMYFSAVWILFLPKIAARIEDKTDRGRFIFAIIALSILYFIVKMILRPEWNHILPYRMF